jgi:MEDS: MEthanogen/methylotroph, DcmR Sensory domain
MRTGAARGHAGHFHEAGFYGSDTEFRALIVPFAEEGIAAGEPVIIGYDSRKNALVRSWLTDPSAVTFPADSNVYATPARAIAAYRRLFELHVAQGAGQIRITGELPIPATEADSTDGIVTKRRSTPSGRTSRYGACAYMTPRPRRPRCSMLPSGRIPASSRPRAPAARTAASRGWRISKLSLRCPIHWNRPRP